MLLCFVLLFSLKEVSGILTVAKETSGRGCNQSTVFVLFGLSIGTIINNEF